MKEFKYKPYSRTREVLATIGEIVGTAIAYIGILVVAYIFLAIA